ncbi:hypothetical protein PPN31114_00265 [Pandoraea pneumonica]|uniref:Bacteriophage Mx8 p63 C-terminal domain-containing protein n=1 Tax=Pandoraea pneumonica TaxID=2508299 RepID=A0A5E4RLM1_9BURK|nr:hypothetical protein PPN31114_00265 [Pandoraea pneumonica]
MTSESKNAPKNNGKSAGGNARAKALTSSQRTEIAKKAAAARHKAPASPVATHKGMLKIGETEIPCFVLDDGRRVISGRGLTAAIGMKGRGQGVGRIRAMKAVNSYENNGLLLAISEPIKFTGGSPRVGETSDGFEAAVLQDLCEALLQSRDLGLLVTEHEKRYAQFADTLIRAFARVGIVALVDEATGYQSERPQDALQAYLEKLIQKDLAVWVKKFPDEFYENIYKLRGWVWPGMQTNRYSVVAKYTTDLIYDRMANGLTKALIEKSPMNDSGTRTNKLHQWLSPQVGDPMLAAHMQSVLTIQRLSIANGWGWNKFLKMMDQVMPKKGQTLEIPLDVDAN